MNAASFFVPSFLQAMTENTEESFKSIIPEPSPSDFSIWDDSPAFFWTDTLQVLIYLLPVILGIQNFLILLCFECRFYIFWTGYACLGR